MSNFYEHLPGNFWGEDIAAVQFKSDADISKEIAWSINQILINKPPPRKSCFLGLLKVGLALFGMYYIAGAISGAMASGAGSAAASTAAGTAATAGVPAAATVAATSAVPAVAAAQTAAAVGSIVSPAMMIAKGAGYLSTAGKAYSMVTGKPSSRLLQVASALDGSKNMTDIMVKAAISNAGLKRDELKRSTIIAMEESARREQQRYADYLRRTATNMRTAPAVSGSRYTPYYGPTAVPSAVSEKNTSTLIKIGLVAVPILFTLLK